MLFISQLRLFAPSAALLFASAFTVHAATVVVVDENSHGTINGAALTATTTGTDPNPPSHTNVLTYGPLGYNGAAGSVEFSFGSAPNPGVVVRFNGDGYIRFYAAPGVGVNDSSQATMSVPAIFPFPVANTITLRNVSGSIYSYTPQAGQPGYDATNTPTYIFQFANSSAPTGLLNPTGSNLEDAYQVEYVSNLDMADAVVNITNAGSSAGVTAPSTTSRSGSICANVYVHQSNSQLLSCCSCNIAPDALNSYPVIFGSNALLAKSATKPTSVTIDVVATTPGSGGVCDATFQAAPFTLVNGMSARGTRSHRTPTTDVTLTETVFAQKALSTGEAQRLQTSCASLGSAGQCPACTTGGLAEPIPSL